MACAILLIAGLSACVTNQKMIQVQGDGTTLASVTRTESGPLWDRIDKAEFTCDGKCYPTAPTFILTPDLEDRFQVVGGRDLHVLPDGSAVQLYRINGLAIDSVIDNLSKVVAVHCNDDGCIGVDITYGDPIHANKTRGAIVLTYGAARAFQPHWLPDWLTGRSAGGSSSSSAAATGGGAGGPPGGVPGGPGI